MSTAVLKTLQVGGQFWCHILRRMLAYQSPAPEEQGEGSRGSDGGESIEETPCMYRAPQVSHFHGKGDYIDISLLCSALIRKTE